MNIANALTAPTPVNDPLEPNDDVTFIDGTSFRDPDPYIWRGFPRSPLRASVDVVEDPVDTYRVQVPAGRERPLAPAHDVRDADRSPSRHAQDARRQAAGALGEEGGATDAADAAKSVGACRRRFLRRDHLGEQDVAELVLCLELRRARRP